MEEAICAHKQLNNWSRSRISQDFSIENPPNVEFMGVSVLEGFLFLRVCTNQLADKYESCEQKSTFSISLV